MSAFERVQRCEVITTSALWRKGEPDKFDSRTVITTRYTVTGVEAVPLHGEHARNSARLYVPVAVVIERAGSSTHITVSGCLQRKDGTLSETRHAIHGLSAWHSASRPAWLNEIVRDADR